jgi:hypothetical protein
MITTALWTTWLAACGGGPTLDIEVIDVWSNPVSSAIVVQDGVTERITVDSKGRASIEVEPGKIRLSAGAEGYIKQSSVVEIVAESENQASTTLTLFPIPTSAGFHGIGNDAYVKMVEAPVVVLASEMTAFHGIKDIPKDAALPQRDQPHRFVFQTTLREQELKRMDIHLSKLVFKPTAPVTGPLGEVEVDVNLWVAESDVNYNVRSMDAPDNYLVVVSTKLDPGVYAFHAQGILDAREADALDKLPKEMKVVYAFEVR